MDEGLQNWINCGTDSLDVISTPIPDYPPRDQGSFLAPLRLKRMCKEMEHVENKGKATRSMPLPWYKCWSRTKALTVCMRCGNRVNDSSSVGNNNVGCRPFRHSRVGGRRQGRLICTRIHNLDGTCIPAALRRALQDHPRDHWMCRGWRWLTALFIGQSTCHRLVVHEG